ncbi:MAG: hypothetical protein U1E73_07635 [Planctomycetota bacterium]
MGGEWKATSTADGAFAIGRAPLLPGMQIHASRTGYRSAHAPLATRQFVHLVLERAPVLCGRVVDEQGQGVAAAVFCNPAGASSDADGRFEIDVANVSSPWLVAAVQGHLPGRLKCENGPPNEPSSWPQPLVLRLGGPALAIAGRAFDSDGAPLAAPQVTLLDAECLVPGNNMSSIEEFLARVHSRVTADGAEFWESAMPGTDVPGAARARRPTAPTGCASRVPTPASASTPRRSAPARATPNCACPRSRCGRRSPASSSTAAATPCRRRASGSNARTRRRTRCAARRR